MLQRHQEEPDGVGGRELERVANAIEGLALLVRRLTPEQLPKGVVEVTHGPRRRTALCTPLATAMSTSAIRLPILEVGGCGNYLNNRTNVKTF